MIVYLCFGIPLSILCYIHFGRIIRVFIRRIIRRIEEHFFRRTEPNNLRQKVIFYNSVMIIMITILAAVILKLNGEQSWTFVDCLYHYTGVVSTSGMGHSNMNSEFLMFSSGLSVLIEIMQLLAVGLVSSLIQAIVSLQRAKHHRGKLHLKPHQTTNQVDRPEASSPRNNVVNGTVAMDSLVILVQNEG